MRVIDLITAVPTLIASTSAMAVPHPWLGMNIYGRDYHERKEDHKKDLSDAEKAKIKCLQTITIPETPEDMQQEPKRRNDVASTPVSTTAIQVRTTPTSASRG